MRVFVLCTGRCGSVTFAKACAHLTNFSAGHESRWDSSYADRFSYPDNHVEVDNRLSWYLGALDRHFGQGASYVHLFRDPEDTAQSYAARWEQQRSIVRAYGLGIARRHKFSPLDAAREMVSTVTDNIAAFLKDKPHRIDVRLSHVKGDFTEFLAWIGARGDLEAAIQTWDVKYNPRESTDGETLLLPDAASLQKRIQSIEGRVGQLEARLASPSHRILGTVDKALRATKRAVWRTPSP